MTSVLLILAGVFGTVQYQDHKAIQSHYAEYTESRIMTDNRLADHDTKLVYLYKTKANLAPTKGVKQAIPNGNPFEEMQ